MSRRGFTIIEILTTLAVMGILAGIAALKYMDLTRTALAAKIAGEFVTVRLAAYNYEADHFHSWPADQGPGIVPPGMVQYLPRGFSFVAPSYELDWDNRSPSRVPYQLAISVTTTDSRLMNALVQNLGTRAPYFVSANRLTFILIDQDGNY